MGKIRSKIIGLEDVEKEQSQKAKARREAKKALKGDKKEATKETKKSKKEALSEVVEVVEKTETEEVGAAAKKSDKKSSSKEQGKRGKVRVRGKNYVKAKKLVDAKKTYPLKDAVALLRSMKYATFDESVELHVNTKEANIKGEVSLPHGTGKTVRVVVADDALLAKINDGVIDFDILIAEPSFMPKLVKFARVLGPKGLMPNPKTGTVTDKTAEAVKKFSSGTLRFKTEAKFPIIHQVVGKMSHTDAQLVENVEALVKAIVKKNILNLFISSSMTPSVQITLEKE